MNTLDWEHVFSLDTPSLPWPHLTPLADLPLVILVGLTGVGKTTTLNQLDNMGVPFTLLPNRRKITDEVIITAMQREDGQPPAPVKDRLARFDYTARYRARYPGGMAFALSRLAVNPFKMPFPLIFDGLRGLEEVQQAAYLLKRVRFVVLDAPDTVRLTRLLQRGDAFDAAAVRTETVSGDWLAALKAIPDVGLVFSPNQIEQMARWGQTAQFTVDDVVKKVSIIVEERRNYDSNMARIYLSHTLPPGRVLVADTAAHWAGAVAKQIADWLKAGE